MAVSERARHELFERLQRAIGEDHTETLMDLLPPVGWADVATKQDLNAGLQSLEHRLQGDMARLESSLQRELRQQLFAMLGALFTMTGIILTFG